MSDEPSQDLREAVREAQEKMAKWVPKPIPCVSESCDKLMVEVSPFYYRCECGTSLVKCPGSIGVEDEPESPTGSG